MDVAIYHNPLPDYPSQPVAESALFNAIFGDLDAAIAAEGVHYGICTTSAADPQKEVSITGLTQIEGLKLTIKFSNGNTAEDPTLKINLEPPRAIKTDEATAKLKAAPGEIILLVYDGSAYIAGTRIPVAHADSHKTGGSDPLTPADIGAVAMGGDGSNLQVTATAANELANMASGDTLAVVAAKLMKWFSGLVSARIKAGINVTVQTDAEGNVTIDSAAMYDDTYIKTILNKLTS